MANDFSTDGNCVALWRLENGALTADSKGTNTLTLGNGAGSNEPVADTVNFKEGAASADFELGDVDRLTIADASLDAGFPLKSGDTGGKISVCMWFKCESIVAQMAPLAKYSTVGSNRSFEIQITSAAGLNFLIGHTGGASSETTAITAGLSAGRWYHLGLTFNNADKSYQGRLWDDTASSVIANVSGNTTNNWALTTIAFYLGSRSNNTSPYDGLLDEVVIFKDILSTAEIDQIRTGTYGAGGGTTHEASGQVNAVATLAANANANHSLSGSVAGAASLTADAREALFRASGSLAASASLAANAAQTHAVSAPIAWTTGNDFSTDPDCVALWSLEPGALGTDSVGTNTLTNSGVASETTLYREKTGSGDFELADNDSLSITDAGLDAGFPFKTGDTGKKMTVCAWVRCESKPADAMIPIAKYNNTAGGRSWELQLSDSLTIPTLRIGYNSGQASETVCTGSVQLAAGQWYHVGFSFSDATKAGHIRVYDLSGATVYDDTGNSVNNISLVAQPFTLGRRTGATSAYPFDGLLDEVVVFKRILSNDEIDDIRRGQFGNPSLSGGIMGESAVTANANIGWHTGGTIDATSSFAANATRAYSIAAAILAQSLLTAALQWKAGTYVPSPILMDPFPVPMLWQYLHAGTPFDVAVQQWAERLSQWSEEHMIRVMRELNRLGQEKTTEWVS